MRSRLSSLCGSLSSSHISTLRYCVNVGLCCSACDGESANSENVHVDLDEAQVGSGNECAVDIELVC